MIYTSQIDFYENNPYVDKSHIFLNNDTLELYVMFDGYFNKPIDNFKEILYRLKYDSEQIIPDNYFNFEHTLFADFVDVGISDDNSKTNIKNNSLYYSFQFGDCYHIPYLGYSRISDERYIVKSNHCDKINNYYDIKNKNILDISKQIIDKHFLSITKVYFGYEFNNPIENLPDSINWLVLGKNFNQSINKYPSCLKYLTFGFDFNKLVDNLPNMLERIVFGGRFDKSIDNLPDTITHLSFYVEFYSEELYKFGFGSNVKKYCTTVEKNITDTENIYSFALRPEDHRAQDFEICDCEFSQKIIKLPKKLTHLVIDDCKNLINLDNLIESSKLTHLQAKHLSKNFLLNLPNTLEHLSLFVTSPDEIKLPIKLKFIKMNFVNCKEILKSLPEDLEILIIMGNKYYRYDLDNNTYLYDLSNLPSSLKYLKIKDWDKFNYNLDYLPSSLTHLTISTKTNNPLNNLPSSITHLWIDGKNEELFYPQNNIKELYCSNEYIKKNINHIDKNISVNYFN
jgi:hypothetical protein